jgi:deoxycytidine triphosphate deaminase
MNHVTGAVLRADDLRGLSTPSLGIGLKPLIEDWAEDNFRGAKYDMRMADTGMILPGGRAILPDTTEPYTSQVLLRPGETIFVSTRERFHVPLDLVGNMSIKGELSREGVLSLTGLIVDPGYEDGPSADGRLHFRLANLGSRPVVLTPGETRIASIQFLRLTGDARSDPQVFPNVWANVQDFQQGLGFIEDLRDLRSTVDGVRRDFENQRRSIEYVILAGVIVVLTTLLGVSVASVLSLGADSKLVRAAKNVIPKTREGQWLFVLGLFGLAAIVCATTVGVVRGRRPGAPDLNDVRQTRLEAYRDVVINRRQWLAGGAAAASAATWGAVMITVALGWSTPVDVLVGILVGCLATCLALRFCWNPVTPRRVSERMAAWYAEEQQAKG